MNDQDPYAAYGGAVATQPPAAAPSPAPAAAAPAGPDPYAAYGGAVATQQPPTSDAPDTSTIAGRMTIPALKQRLSDLGTGVAQGAASLVLPVDKLVHKIPGVGELLVSQKAIDDEQKLVSQKDPDDPERAANQGVGSDVESLLEFMTGEKGVSAAAKGIGLVERLKQAGEIGKLIEKYPGIAKVIGVGTKDAVVGGGQAAAHGGDASDVAAAATLTGATGGAMEGVGEGARSFTEKRAPKTRTIAGETIPVLASQEPGASKAAKGAANIATEPTYQAAQQEGGQNAVRNIAQDATRNALEQVNASRQPTPRITDPARLLPAPEDMQPFTFSIEGPNAPDEVQTGAPGDNGVSYGGERQVANPDYRPAAIGEQEGEIGKPTVGATPERAIAGEPTKGESHWYYNPPATGEASSEFSGSGSLQTQDPALARQTLAQMQDVKDSGAYDKMSPARQARLDSGIQTLRSQLNDFGSAKAAEPHFDPADVEASVRQTGDFNDAAQHIEEAVKPVYDKLDEVSNNEFGSLRKQQIAVNKIIRNPTTPEAYDAAVQRRTDINSKIQKIFDDNREQISPEEHRAANQAWRMASTARDLHSTIESTFNGISPDVAARTGIDRTMKGGTPAYKRLSRLLSDRGEDVKGLIGQKGVDGLYQVANLLKTPEKAEGFGKLMKDVSTVLRRHGVGIGGVAGGLMAHGIGGAIGHAIPSYYGFVAGAAAEAGYRKAANMVATNPEIAQRVAYALKNGVSNRVSAPIIAMMMTGSIKDRQKEQQ